MGLPFFVLIKVFSPGYFAREDTVTPMRYGAVAVVLNVIVSVVLFPLVGALGIAAATSFSSAVNALLLAVTLYRRGHLAGDPRLAQRLGRIFLAAVAMGGVLLVLGEILVPWFDRQASFVWNVTALMALVGGGMAAFGIAALGFRAVTIADLKALLRRRGP